MSFVCLSFLELVHSFNIKSNKSILKSGILKNWYLIGATILGVLMQIIVVVIPKISTVFNTVPLNKTQWIYVLLISFLPLAIIEMQKKINEIKYGKRVYKTVFR